MIFIDGTFGWAAVLVFVVVLVEVPLAVAGVVVGTFFPPAVGFVFFGLCARLVRRRKRVDRSLK